MHAFYICVTFDDILIKEFHGIIEWHNVKGNNAKQKLTNIK